MFVITREHVLKMIENMKDKRILRNMGSCYYSAPCIIGSIMPANMRRNLRDSYHGKFNVANISNLILGKYDGEDVPYEIKVDSDVNNYWLTNAQIHFDNGAQESCINALKTAINYEEKEETPAS